jgi:hypothetical protein
MYDPLASNIVSLVLAWIIAVPIFLAVTLGTISQTAELFSERNSGSLRWLRWFGVYYLLCLLIISPMRYMILQLLLIDSYFVQSFSAVANSLLAGMYGMIVFSLLFAVSIGVPNILLLGALTKETKATPIIAAILTPFAFAIGYALFFLVLPYAAWTIHWLGARDVIRSANGPATVFYKLAVEPDIPRIGPKLEIEKGETANERLRSHIARTYVSDFKRNKLHFEVDPICWARNKVE